MKALTLTTGIKTEDILYSSFSSKVGYLFANFFFYCIAELLLFFDIRCFVLHST